MDICRGTSLLEKIAIGKIYFYKRRGDTPFREETEDESSETARFDSACEAALAELDELIRIAAAEAGEEEAAVFRAHMMLVRDPLYRGFVIDSIENRKVNAEYAVAQAQAHFVRMLLGVEDDYVRERAADVADVSERLLRILGGGAGRPPANGEERQPGEETGRLPENGEGRQPGEETGRSPDIRGTGPAEPSIIAAEALMPSDIVRFDRSLILAFVVRDGTENSHMAILARAMNIPVLLGIDVREDWAGRTAVVDGCSGEIILDPDAECLERMRGEQAEIDESEECLRWLRGQETVTRSGRKINLYANVSEGSDVDAALENGAEGIGLFRSEFLYLQAPTWPAEEEQFAAYRAAAEAMRGKKVVIRTLDAGADKQIPYMELPENSGIGGRGDSVPDNGCREEAGPENGCREEAGPDSGYREGSGPGSGERGIRICLDRPEMFRIQLRAILRAAAYGNVAVMFPMIRSVEELRECARQLAIAREELEQANPQACYGDVEAGIMIETPEAVERSAELAREAGFFCIGTNDLIPALLGYDRFGAQPGPGGEQNRAGDERPGPGGEQSRPGDERPGPGGEQSRPGDERTGPGDEQRDPAVLRAIRRTVENGHAAGIWVGVCGEMAADTGMTETLVDMGIDELSVAPAAILRVREKVINCS